MRSGLETGTDATPTSVGDGSIEGVTLDPQALGWGGGGPLPSPLLEAICDLNRGRLVEDV